MKVYALPKDLPIPAVDFANFDRDKMYADEEDHKRRVKEWLIKNGYTGKHTGEIFRVSVADGYAVYMLAEGKKSFLIHLPYGDGYNYRDVAFLPKAEVLRRIEAEKRISALFTRKEA